MTIKNRKFYLFIFLFASIPLPAKAFLTFCFPISLTVLLFVLGWPWMIFGELTTKLIPKVAEYNSFTFALASGLLIDILILFFLASWIDAKEKKSESHWFKKRKYKWPIIFILIIGALFGLAYVDPTCA